MNNIEKIAIWAAIIGGLFVFLWVKGYLKQLVDYVQQMREELHKCTWPSWEELKGSTIVVAISLVLLGGFTVGVDSIFYLLFSKL